MLCEQIMKRNVECLAPKDNAQTAARKMRDQNVGFLPVCENGNKVLGTLTDRDIVVRLVAENRPNTTPVADIMTKEVVACRPKEDLTRVEQLMAQHHKSRVLVIDENNLLVGVISLSDIAERDGAHAAQTMKQVSERETRTH